MFLLNQVGAFWPGSQLLRWTITIFGHQVLTPSPNVSEIWKHLTLFAVWQGAGIPLGLTLRHAAKTTRPTWLKTAWHTFWKHQPQSLGRHDWTGCVCPAVCRVAVTQVQVWPSSFPGFLLHPSNMGCVWDADCLLGEDLLAQSVGGRERGLPAGVIKPKPFVWNWERWDDSWGVGIGGRNRIMLSGSQHLPQRHSDVFKDTRTLIQHSLYGEARLAWSREMNRQQGC